MFNQLYKTRSLYRFLLLALVVLPLLSVGSGCKSDSLPTLSSTTESAPQSSEPKQTVHTPAESSLTPRELRRKQLETAINRGKYSNHAIAVGYADESEKAMGWLNLFEDLKIELLDIGFTIPMGIGEEEKLIRSLYACSSHNLPFWRRTNALPYGLSQFCPTLSFPYSLRRPHDEKYNENLDTFIDIHIRKKDGAVGENFCDLTSYIGRRASSDIALLTETVESYHNAADFYEKNFAKAEAGTDENYVEFTRLPDQKIGNVTAYHYSFERNMDTVPPPEEEGAYCVIEAYGEHYLFETDRYIYVFAYSGQLPVKGYKEFYAERDGKVQELFRSIVEGIEFKTDQAEEQELPIWANNEWIQEHISEEPKRVLPYLREAKEMKGELPESVKELLEEAE